MDASEESPPAHCRYCGELHPATFSHCPKTGQSLHAGRALIGRVIAGRYRVLGLLGEGGMGAVYVAEHLMIGRKVALKRLHPELMGDEKAVKRFQREARAAASIGHEHIVEVLDLGFSEDGAPFLVMEYLRGKSLAQLLREGGPLEPRRACDVVGQVLAALSAVHQRGIVHRDLKPDNVIVSRRGARDFVKVVDFGISKMQEDGETGLGLTRTGVMLGTPCYMSPEQARGMKDLDHRVDLYGAAVMLYECITGRLPFEGANYHQLLQAILVGTHPRAREVRPEVSPGLDDVVERSLALDPAQRYATARELLLALVPHGANDPGATESVPPPDDALLADAKTTSLARPSLEREPTTDPLPPERPELRATVLARATPRGLAPEPREVGVRARRFIAQSSDWTDEDTSSPAAMPSREVTPSAVRDPSAPYAPRSDAITPALRATLSAPTRVKGSLLLGAIERLSSGGHLSRVLARLDAEGAAMLGRVILPMAWFPLGLYVDLLRATQRELGGTEGTQLVRIGRATADRELTSTHRVFMQSATPAMALERIPQLFRGYHAPGRVTIEPTTTATYRVETHDLEPDALAHALAMSGFYQRMLELAGAQDVRAIVTSCRERGEPATVTILRWR